jgi:uncharacterized membrane protein YfcA
MGYTPAVLDGGDIALLAGAAFVAGAVNAVAGGGSLISFPALLAVGYPSIEANVTNAVAVVPGYLGGSHAYREELAEQGARIRALGAVSAVGAVSGAALLVISSKALFDALVPWLVLFSCALLAAQPVLARRVGPHASDGGPRIPRRVLAMQFAAAVYGGYFGAGLGILMLAVLGIYLQGDLHEINALKGVLSLVVGVVSAVFFAIFAPVAWGAAGVMAVASLAGGQAGVRLVRRVSPTALRAVVVVFGVVVSIRLLTT